MHCYIVVELETLKVTKTEIEMISFPFYRETAIIQNKTRFRIHHFVAATDFANLF
jgi:hypothetical protein